MSSSIVEWQTHFVSNIISSNIPVLYIVYESLRQQVVSILFCKVQKDFLQTNLSIYQKVWKEWGTPGLEQGIYGLKIAECAQCFMTLCRRTACYWPPVVIFQSAVFNLKPASVRPKQQLQERSLSSVVSVLYRHHWNAGCRHTWMWNYWANKPSLLVDFSMLKKILSFQKKRKKLTWSWSLMLLICC